MYNVSYSHAGNFDIGLEQTKSEIYLNKRASFVSEKPKYKSGEISLFTEDMRFA